MKWPSTLWLVLLCTMATSPMVVRAQTAVSIELVLAIDASSSVNQAEFELQALGIAHAFRSPEVIGLIEQADGVAVTLVQWSSWANLERALPWRLLTDKSSVLSFATEVDGISRAPVGSLTGIGTAIRDSLRALAHNQYAGRRRIIDVSGDGQNNAGIPLQQARRLARSSGVTVNGLAIQTDFPNLAGYFRERIIVGSGAFVIAAADYPDFARAMHAKLLRELSQTISQGPLNSMSRAQLTQRR